MTTATATYTYPDGTRAVITYTGTVAEIARQIVARATAAHCLVDWTE